MECSVQSFDRLGHQQGHEGRLSRDPLSVFSTGGPCEQFRYGQEWPLFDVVHPAFPLPTMSHPPCKVPWRTGLERLSRHVTCQNHESFCPSTVARRGSCGPIRTCMEWCQGKRLKTSWLGRREGYYKRWLGQHNKTWAIRWHFNRIMDKCKRSVVFKNIVSTNHSTAQKATFLVQDTVPPHRGSEHYHSKTQMWSLLS